MGEDAHIKERGLFVKKKLCVFTLLCSLCALNGNSVEWLVVGAGPAGIATICLLRHLGIPDNQIGWVDPEFNVGRIGQFYSSVPANNTTIKFVEFIDACHTSHEFNSPSLDELRAQPPHEFPPLGIIIPALTDLSAHIRTKIVSYQGWLQGLHYKDGFWRAHVNELEIKSHNVVLATGSHPRELSYDTSAAVIPLDYALDKAQLATYVTRDQTIGVIGGSHSGILLLKYLYELEVKKIINFYHSPIVYTVDMGGWYMNAYNGLKGLTAQWAREVLEGPNPPKNIMRVYNSTENRAHYLPECDKIIYSVGYEPNETPLTEEYTGLHYNDVTGVIAPGLFGIGIAFPEYYNDPLGNHDHRVGLTSFMDYAQRIIPQWIAAGAAEGGKLRSELLHYRKTMLEKYAELFTIDIL